MSDFFPAYAHNVADEDMAAVAKPKLLQNVIYKYEASRLVARGKVQGCFRMTPIVSEAAQVKYEQANQGVEHCLSSLECGTAAAVQASTDQPVVPGSQAATQSSLPPSTTCCIEELDTADSPSADLAQGRGIATGSSRLPLAADLVNSAPHPAGPADHLQRDDKVTYGFPACYLSTAQSTATATSTAVTQQSTGAAQSPSAAVSYSAPAVPNAAHKAAQKPDRRPTFSITVDANSTDGASRPVPVTGAAAHASYIGSAVSSHRVTFLPEDIPEDTDREQYKLQAKETDRYA